jgi:hypothetical protein
MLVKPELVDVAAVMFPLEVAVASEVKSHVPDAAFALHTFSLNNIELIKIPNMYIYLFKQNRFIFTLLKGLDIYVVAFIIFNFLIVVYIILFRSFIS